MGHVVFGASSAYVSEVIEIFRRLDQPIDAFVVNVASGEVPSEADPVVRASEIRAEWLEAPVVVPLTTPGYRKVAVAHARSLGFRRFPAVVDPTAIVANSATMGEGAVVNAGAIVGAKVCLGPFASVNRGVSIGHDVTTEEFVSFGPSCVLGGFVRALAGAFVGAGAVVLPTVRLGRNSIVGAGAVVTTEVPDHAMVVGNPARVVKMGVPGFNGVSV